MDDWPKLNEVHCDNTPEPESKVRSRQGCLEYLLFVLWGVMIHLYSRASGPFVLTWRGWGILLVCFVILGVIGDRLGKRYAWLVDKPYFAIVIVTIVMALLTMFWTECRSTD